MLSATRDHSDSPDEVIPPPRSTFSSTIGTPLVLGLGAGEHRLGHGGCAAPRRTQSTLRSGLSDQRWPLTGQPHGLLRTVGLAPLLCGGTRTSTGVKPAVAADGIVNGREQLLGAGWEGDGAAPGDLCVELVKLGCADLDDHGDLVASGP